jgi:hypothetical protein
MTLSHAQRQHLRGLLGQHICFRGTQARIIEFLEQEQALVLQLAGQQARLQDSQYGEPGRRVAGTRLLPILDPDRPGELNPELLSLAPLNEIT